MGYKASGKTTIGRLLAQRLDYEFLDSDEMFQEQYYTTPANYIHQYDMSAFRLKEAQIIQDLKLTSNRVIATGGGVVEELSNVRHLKTLGFIIYLEVAYASILKRLKQTGKIPIFVNLKHYLYRQELYQHIANLRLVLDDEEPNQVVDKIIYELRVSNGQ